MTEPTAPDINFPRLSSRSFPPYRYVHGLNAHPTLSKDGHSYGALEIDARHEVPLLLGGRWTECAQYRYGIDLYNFAYWWEAHETWESVWIHADPEGPLKRLLQCLIQVSAAHFQRHAGIAGGVTRLLERADKHRQAMGSESPLQVGFNIDNWWHSTVLPYFKESGSHFPFIILKAD